MNFEQVLLDVAEALRVPVFVLALLALALVLYELGAFGIELSRRRSRDFDLLERATDEACAALVERRDPTAARHSLAPVAWSPAMTGVLAFIVAQRGTSSARPSPGAGERVSKALADFDLRSMRRLERTRMLVRAGPGLGLMGTLIPLSPALAALGEGDVRELSEGLRVAFGVTVVGILIGLLAYGLSLVRDRLYAQDHSDLEYVAARLWD
jgi:biopolymer transport protein ExbB/TolQ